MTPLSQTSFSAEQNQTILLYERSYVPVQYFSIPLSICLSTDSILFDIFDANKEKRVKCLIIRDRLFQVTSQCSLTNPLRFIVANVSVNFTKFYDLTILLSCESFIQGRTWIQCYNQLKNITRNTILANYRTRSSKRAKVKRDLLILTVKRTIMIFNYCAKIVVVGQDESLSRFRIAFSRKYTRTVFVYKYGTWCVWVAESFLCNRRDTWRAIELARDILSYATIL